MFKLLSALLFFLALVVSADTRAADNLSLMRYNYSTGIPDAYLVLGGGDAMVKQTYLDDDRKVRTDKVYYAASHSYKSTYKAEDIAKILNPASGRLGSLFKETEVKNSNKTGMFDVFMTISTAVKNFNCTSNLTFKSTLEGNKNIFIYTFSSFNMVFTSMTIKVEVEEVGSTTNIKLSQISAVKGSTMAKLNSYSFFGALGQFETGLKDNLKKLKSGVGGI